MTRFSGQTAVITGAAGRLGSAVARRLVNEGASVMLADMNLSAVTALAQSLDNDRCRVGAFQVDIASAAEVAGLYARTFELFGRIDVVHNNAAMIGDGPDGSSNIGELPPDVWSRTLNVNVTGAMHVIKHALPYMIRQGSGAIVNTSSIASLLGEDVRSAYSASKAALNALTRHVATAYGRHGIRCNAVAPGLMRADASSPDAAPWRRHNAVPYVGTFDDVALVVAFLASSDARYVTGQVIVADGGFSAHFPNWADGGHRTGLGPAPTT